MKTYHRLRISCMVVLVLAMGSGQRVEPPLFGIIVEHVTPNGGGEEAGLLPGDVLVSWQAKNTSTIRGELTSPFDWLWLEQTQTPIDTLLFRAYRDGSYFNVEMDERPWRVDVRPCLPPWYLAAYNRGLSQVEEKDYLGANATWTEMARTLAAEGGSQQACGLLLAVAERFRRAKQRGLANGAFNASLKLAEAMGYQASVPVLETFAKFKITPKHASEALPLLERAVGLTQTHLGDSLATAQAHYLLGAVYKYTTAYEKAEQHMRIALALRQKLAPGSSAVARAMYNLAAIAERRGNYATTANYFHQAADIESRRASASEKLSKNLAGLGAALRALGKHAQAEKALRQAISKKAANETLVRIHTELGHLYGDFKSFDQSRTHYNLALALLSKNDPNHFAVYNGLGTLAFQEHHFDVAQVFYSRALEFALLHNDSLKRVEVRINQAQVALDQGRPQIALDFLKQVEAPLVSSKNMVQKAYHARLFGVALRQLDRPMESRRHLQQAIHILTKSGHQGFDLSLSHFELGLLERRQGKPERARNHLHKAIEAFEEQLTRLGADQNAPLIRSRFSLAYLKQYKELIDLEMSVGQPREAFLVHERSRDASFLHMLAMRELVLRPGAPADLLQRRHDLITRRRNLEKQLHALVETSDKKEELNTELAEIDLALVTLKNEIINYAPRLAKLALKPADLQTTAANLDAGTLLLSYSVHRDHIYLFAILGHEFLSVKLAMDTTAVKHQVNNYIDLLTEQEQHVLTDRLNNRAYDLYQILLAPADALIQKAERLLIVTDGPMHLLPFAALPYRQPSKGVLPSFLGLEKPIHGIQSSTLYQFYRQKRDERNKGPMASQVMIFRALDLEEQGYQPLPAAKHEEEAIEDLFPNARRAYRKKDFKQIRQPCRIVHFVTHAIINANQPMDSHLVLTAGDDDGKLYVSEILEMEPLDLDLVVLSACQTALGQDLGGEGLMSLARAFQFAGARSVMASLWKVDDPKTAALMKRVYRALKAGHDKDEALRIARREFVASDNGKWQHPYYWAAFRLIGDPSVGKQATQQAKYK